MNKLAYVVPTKDRPDDLKKLFDSLSKQTVMPDQIVVVDGSDPDIKYVCDEYDELKITYIRCFPPSLSKQRNAGMNALVDEITIAGYLDDDLVLEDDATENMQKFWVNAESNVGGASLSIINQGDLSNKWFYKFFMMSGDPPGRVLGSGFPCHYPFIEETIDGEWLYGGATIWRREVIQNYQYDEWYIGHGFLEDLDYSYRVSRNYKLYVVGDARTYHFSHEMSPTAMYEFGKQQIINRLYFVNKIKTFSRVYVAWGILGQILLNFISFIKSRNKPSFDRFYGNLYGLIAYLSGRKESYLGYWK